MNLTQLRIQQPEVYKKVVKDIVEYPLRQTAVVTGDIKIRYTLRTLQRKLKDEYGLNLSRGSLTSIRMRNDAKLPDNTIAASKVIQSLVLAERA